jgi:primosomal protein N''
MATFKSLTALLDDASTLLDRAAGEIRDLPLEPTGANIRQIGSALSQIHELQLQIYALAPELTPRSLREPSDKPIIALAYALRRAREFENVGETDTAVAFLRLFLVQGGTASEREVVSNEIAKLQQRDA